MVGILNAYHFESNQSDSYQQEYSQMFVEFVTTLFLENKKNIIEYKVALGQVPNSINECDVWFITGSPKSVYEDISWVHWLIDFTRALHRGKKKLIAICFGHQMVAFALGGKVNKSENGWGVGVREFNILKTENWMTPYQSKLSLIFSHQDQVEVLPPMAQLIASDDFCRHQMMQIESHILTFQGHPEFTKKFALSRLNSQRSLLPIETYDKALKSFEQSYDFQKINIWIKKFITL